MSQTVRLLLTLALFGVAAGLGFTGWLITPPEAIIRWSTESEVETAGFHVTRATQEGGPYTRVTDSLIPSSGDPFSGSDYEFRDPTVEPGQLYYYQLEELESNGIFTPLPETVTFQTGSDPLSRLAYLRWEVVSALLVAFALLWLLPGPRRPTPPAQEVET